MENSTENKNQHGYTVIIDSSSKADEDCYKDTALPFSQSVIRPKKEKIPERIREMKHLYKYGRESLQYKAKNFYRQAVFMQDYEDDVPWEGDFACYFPTYHDLTTRQLRGYFTWRTHLRRGNFKPIPSSAAYIYIYELLNGVGADSPQDTVEKLKEFDAGFIDSGIGDINMRQNLKRWMVEFAVIHNLSPKFAESAADERMIEADKSLAALKSPWDCPDEEVFKALCFFGGEKLKKSPVLSYDSERGRHLFCQAWRKTKEFCLEGKGLFELCFGKRASRGWYPLSNAVFYPQHEAFDTDYILNECRSFHCRNAGWQVSSYEKTFFDRKRFKGFLHEADALFRRYLKTGRYLSENPADEWCIPYLKSVIEADKKEIYELSRPKIEIDLLELDQIRINAGKTRDSLLIEEKIETVSDQTTEPLQKTKQGLAPEQETKDVPRESIGLYVLDALIKGEDALAVIKENHLMPSIVADEINESLYDEFGDTVVQCENDRLSLVDEYTEELKQYLRGMQYHG